MIRIRLVKDDITTLDVDAIVNAANAKLQGGGGVDGAIHRAGGPEIIEECQNHVSRNGPCLVGDAIITSGGNLSASFVIHAVGPVWSGGDNNEEYLLKQAYINSLFLAERNFVKTIAFPNISTGVYKFPKKEAAKIAIKVVKDYLEKNNHIHEVIFCCYDDENYNIYSDLLSGI